VTIDCTQAGPCTGILTVSCDVEGGVAVGASAGRHPRRIVIGTATFTKLPAGQTSKVPFRLNPTGRRLLTRAHGKLKVTVTLHYTAAGKVATSRVVLRLRSSAKR
jgi:hypothetical protein